MHAKVWVFDNSAVISSANLTGGGLGLASEDKLRQPELGVIVRSPSRVDWLDGWFERLWKEYQHESQKLEQLLAKELEEEGRPQSARTKQRKRLCQKETAACPVWSWQVCYLLRCRQQRISEQG